MVTIGSGDSGDALLLGEMTVEGRMPWSSNATFLVSLTHGDETVRAIYKPHRGERPLWDFPGGLYRREVAMYELAALLGWDVVPRTVVRDGDLGIGSAQRFVEDSDYDRHYFVLLENHPESHAQLRTIATLDLLANNADRKGGHILEAPDGSLWAIDNGLCFHEEPKLRTVMWDFAGEHVPEVLLPDVERLAALEPGELGPLDELLEPDEVAVLLARARRLLRKPIFPSPSSNYAYPWPMV